MEIIYEDKKGMYFGFRNYQPRNTMRIKNHLRDEERSISDKTGVAIDFDGDGKRDIMNNAADAIGSVANFLSSEDGNKRGWNKDGFIAIPSEAKRKNKNIKSSYKLVPYKELDIIYDGNNYDFTNEYIQISLFPSNEEKDEFWIGDKNLYAITRYNPSSKYAMSVFLLSEELKN